MADTVYPAPACKNPTSEGQKHKKLGALKMREWKNRHGQNSRAGKCRSGNIGTVLQGVKNAGVEFDLWEGLKDLNSCAFTTLS